MRQFGVAWSSWVLGSPWSSKLPVWVQDRADFCTSGSNEFMYMWVQRMLSSGCAEWRWKMEMLIYMETVWRFTDKGMYILMWERAVVGSSIHFNLKPVQCTFLLGILGPWWCFWYVSTSAEPLSSESAHRLCNLVISPSPSVLLTFDLLHFCFL